jgi:hypothetical protein
LTVNFNRLFAVDKINQHIGDQNLVISFDYPQDSLEKVSYDLDSQNQKFNIKIEPKPGLKAPDPQSVRYSYSGSEADVIFVIGARSLEDLGSLYQEEKKLLDNQEKILVNLSSLDNNAQFGRVNLYDPTASGCSEIVTAVLTELNLPLDSDIATNLLAGIEASTDNFSSPNVSADTFELAAFLIKTGAKKGFTTAFSSPRPPSPTPVVSPQAQPRPFTSDSAPFSPDQIPSQSSPKPSPDWLKPKVFKSSPPKL